MVLLVGIALEALRRWLVLPELTLRAIQGGRPGDGQRDGQIDYIGSISVVK